MVKLPQINIAEVHALAGVFVPHVPAAQNPLLVIVTHSKTKDNAEGCGALGHLNPHHAEHGVKEIFEGLKAHGIDPETYFGMNEKELASAVRGVGFETDANVRAQRLLSEAKAHGIPVVSANYGHEDGSVTIIGTYNLAEIDYASPIELSGAVCADARVPTEILASTAKCALEKRKVCMFPELVAKDAAEQKPFEAVVYGKGTLVPSNNSGATFKVVIDPKKGVDLAAKLSIAYAITNFGPQGKGPKSMLKIKLHNVGDAVKAELTRNLSGAKGIKIA
ncbi:MAG: hypothetical protein WC408_06105 [Candidatus Micrarchaeia archaeon]|jgi:hypothetical protein